MAIFVTGDTHGCRRPGMHSVDGYLHRLSEEAFPEQKKLSKDDYVLVPKSDSNNSVDELMNMMGSAGGV